MNNMQDNNALYMTKLNLYEAPESIFIELRSSQLLMLSAGAQDVTFSEAKSFENFFGE